MVKEQSCYNFNMLKKGFTLIELLVVIAIVALLSSVVLASVSNARMKARDVKRISDFRQIKIALELYFDANGYYPKTNCGWDCNGYRVSYLKDNTVDGLFSSWDYLATDLKPYISNLPIDPINSSCAPFISSNCYSYMYGNVGRITHRNTYDLWTLLETPNHPLSCKYQKYRWAEGQYTNTFGVCAESAGPYSGIYPSQSYVVSNE